MAASSDCDDVDATVYLGAAEVCDEADNDCDGDISELIEAWTFDGSLEAERESSHDFSGSAHAVDGQCGEGMHNDGTLMDVNEDFTRMAWADRTFYLGANPAGGMETGRYDLDELQLYDCPMEDAAIEAHFTCGGCGCEGEDASPCASDEYWTGTGCEAG